MLISWFKYQERDLQDGKGVRRGDHLLPHKYIKNTLHVKQLLHNTYRMLAEDLRLPKRWETPKYLGRGKEKRKNRHKRIGTGPAPPGGSCERGKVSPHEEAPSLVETGAGGKLHSHGWQQSNRGTEGKAERFPHRGSVPTSTHQPERLVCSPTRVAGGWELRLGLQRSDPREKTRVGCVDTAWRGLVCHS